VPALPLPPPAQNAPVPPAIPAADGTRRLLAVPYAAIPGVRPLELDLYLPAETSTPVPATVFLHGGGWRLGSRHSAGPAFAGADPSPFVRLARRGIAVASVDYRLSGEARWPAQLHDAKAAVRWLRLRAGELGLDGDRIAAWGDSAGGHLAALLGLTGTGAAGADLEGEVGVLGPPSAVSAVVAWYPPTDLPALAGDLGADPWAADSREAQLVGAPLPAVPELAAQASPASHVRPDAPPFLLLHGRNDHLVPCAQSERFRRLLATAGTEVEFDVYDGADHMWLGSPDAADRALERTIDFLDRHLKPDRR
jgi:acetyl esterase/lipase